MPATIDLAGAEIELVNGEHRTQRLRNALADAPHDICFIDCPPSLGLLTLNALGAANSLLVPLQCEFFALEGLSQLLQTVEQVKGRFNPQLVIVGIVLTMYDRRNRLTDATGTLQLRFGHDNRWYGYESDPGEDDWWPRAAPDPDPVAALTALRG